MEKEIILDKRDKCKDCKGTGAEGGGKVITCPKCHGQGQIRTTRRTIFGNIASAAICEIAKVQVKCRKSRVDLRRKRNLRRENFKRKNPSRHRRRAIYTCFRRGEAGYRGSSPGLFCACASSRTKNLCVMV